MVGERFDLSRGSIGQNSSTHCAMKASLGPRPALGRGLQHKQSFPRPLGSPCGPRRVHRITTCQAAAAASAAAAEPRPPGAVEALLQHILVRREPLDGCVRVCARTRAGALLLLLPLQCVCVRARVCGVPGAPHVTRAKQCSRVARASCRWYPVDQDRFFLLRDRWRPAFACCKRRAAAHHPDPHERPRRTRPRRPAPLPPRAPAPTPRPLQHRAPTARAPWRTARPHGARRSTTSTLSASCCSTAGTWWSRSCACCCAPPPTWRRPCCRGCCLRRWCSGSPWSGTQRCAHARARG